MLVKTIREHSNEYGDTHEKAVGDEYDAPIRAAEMLEANRYVDIVQDDGVEGTGGGAGGNEKIGGKGGRTKGA